MESITSHENEIWMNSWVARDCPFTQICSLLCESRFNGSSSVVSRFSCKRTYADTRQSRDRCTKQNSLSQRAENGRGSECRSFWRHGTRDGRSRQERKKEEEKRGEESWLGREKEKNAKRNEILAKWDSANEIIWLIGDELQLLRATSIITSKTRDA